MVNKKKYTKNYQNASKGDLFSKDGASKTDKAKLQEFYSSFLGENIEEAKKNSQRLRFKIYSFGFIVIVIVIVIVLNFFVIGKINFVTS